MHMRIRTYLVMMICLMVACPAWAESISENEARQIASSFMSSHFKTRTNAAPRLAHRSPAVGTEAASPYYVFNAERADGGFVIVAGDDRVPQVLGYSDEGTFDSNDVPPAMQEWLDGYTAQIAALDEGHAMATHITSARPIAPLVKATWSQNSPYYIQLPFLPNGQHAHVGCVATAMAQVMFYWQWPKRSSETLPAYVTKTLNYEMPSLPPVDFNWSAMQDTYYTIDTVSAAGQAAATLSLYCAQSVEMDFKEASSSAYTRDVPFAMARYFGYSPDAIFQQRRFFSSEEWESMLLGELSAHRPVIYSGSKLTGGHAFICDGYDGNGMFHFNWGWNGRSNGYFLLSVLNPDLQGTGSASGTYGYIMSQGFVAGLQPGSSSSSELLVYNRQIEIKDCIDTRISDDQYFKVTLESQFLNCSSGEISFRYALGLYQDDHLIEVMQAGKSENLSSWYYIKPVNTLALGKGVTSGTFRIIPIYCELNSENWRPCVGSNINYIDATISGNNCTFTCHGNALTPNYKVNDIAVEGNMHPKRPVDITLDVTNQGYTRNDLIYMSVNNKVVGVGFADVPNKESCSVSLRYFPETTGSVDLKFTLDEECTNVIANKTITINPLPAAYLEGSATVLNVTSTIKKIITANEFALKVTVTNKGSVYYDEDITVNLYKWIYSRRGSLVQAVSQHLTLAPGLTKELTFHLDNVCNNWNYFAYVYFYTSSSNTPQVTMTSTDSYTIVFPATTVTGDINGDGVVNISDINVLINMILTGNHAPAGDVNKDGQVNISDVNATINIILTGN